MSSCSRCCQCFSTTQTSGFGRPSNIRRLPDKSYLYFDKSPPLCGLFIWGMSPLKGFLQNRNLQQKHPAPWLQWDAPACPAACANHYHLDPRPRPPRGFPRLRVHRSYAQAPAAFALPAHRCSNGIVSARLVSPRLHIV